MAGRGASDKPLTFEGEWNATIQYDPRALVTKDDVLYLCLVRDTGTTPDPDLRSPWYPIIAGAASAAAGFRHGAGDESIIGGDLDLVSSAGGRLGLALGQDAHADSELDTVVGTSARSVSGGYGNTVVGANAEAGFVGSGAQPVERAFALGSNAHANENDLGVLSANVAEVRRSDANGGESALALHDADGVRWFITVDTDGHLTTSTVKPT
jgi:hypothetical protein